MESSALLFFTMAVVHRQQVLCRPLFRGQHSALRHGHHPERGDVQEIQLPDMHGQLTASRRHYGTEYGGHVVRAKGMAEEGVDIGTCS